MNEPWAASAEGLLRSLNTHPRTGLTQVEATNRLKQLGANRLTIARKVSFWRVFREEITEPMILLLLVVGIIYSIWGEARDAITIFVIIIALVFVEIFTEYRAKKGVAALKRFSQPTVTLLRDGQYQGVPTVEVVKGDIAILEVGEIVPADIRVVSSFGLQANESALTGESMPVPKYEKTLASNTVLPERSNMVFAGTTITRGRAIGVVTATGMETELGRITGLVIEAKEPRTGLQQAMKQLSGLLVWIAVSFSILIPSIGLLQHKPLKDMILIGLSLSFATIPEELPIIITMVLGVGALVLSKKNVLIRSLSTAETLGDITTIVTDKTGTITENKMTLSSIWSDGTSKSFSQNALSQADLLLLRIGLLTSCSRRTAGGCNSNDPMEVAIIEASKKAGIVPEDLLAKYILQTEFSFDNERKMMSAVFRQNGQFIVYAKGAPEVILDKSLSILHGLSPRKKTNSDTATIGDAIEKMAGEAMRVIAFAYKELGSDIDITQDESENNLVFVGLAGLADPLRPGVVEALETTRAAGIRTIIVSGDYPLTVQKVASEVGLDASGRVITGGELEGMDDRELKKNLKRVSLYARTTPEQKLRIVRQLQDSGETVAVTGDGINDAPALKSANVGIAMGETGTDVAREAAGMVLADDSFSSITTGIREGRKIFDNLKKGVTYYLSVKIALILTFLIPLFLNLPFPFSPIQIVLLELFMDLAASTTFVVEPMEPGTMQRPPRPQKERFIDRTMIGNLSTGSLCLAAAVLINYLSAWYLGWGPAESQTLAFVTWLVGHIFLAATMRSHRESIWKIGILSNKAMLIWAAAALAFLVLVTNLPIAQIPLKLTSLDATGWLAAFVTPLVTVLFFEVKKLADRAWQRNRVISG
ncbi:MAG TPA: cation-translocating P-type ATPase [Dehalococcoidia bacterium]